jgi:hypothetical protein
LLGPIRWLVPKGVRPIRAIDVASAMLDATLAGEPGIHILKSGAMQPAD